MKKWLLPVLGAAGLSACGVAFVLGLDSELGARTEYRLGSATGPFIGCDNVGGTPAKTQVRVTFTTNADLTAAEVGLMSATTGKVDSNFKTTVPASDLSGTTTQYDIRFYADATTNPLPASVNKQAIVVTPAKEKVKVVSASGNVGAFKPWVRATSGGFTAEFTTKNSVPVYSQCTITSVTGEDV